MAEQDKSLSSRAKNFMEALQDLKVRVVWESASKFLGTPTVIVALQRKSPTYSYRQGTDMLELKMHVEEMQVANEELERSTSAFQQRVSFMNNILVRDSSLSNFVLMKKIVARYYNRALFRGWRQWRLEFSVKAFLAFSAKFLSFLGFGIGCCNNLRVTC